MQTYSTISYMLCQANSVNRKGMSLLSTVLEPVQRSWQRIIRWSFILNNYYTPRRENLLKAYCLRLKFHRASRLPLHVAMFHLQSPCSKQTQRSLILHHLYNIFLIIIHPSQFKCRQVNKHTFPIHASSRARW